MLMTDQEDGQTHAGYLSSSEMTDDDGAKIRNPELHDLSSGTRTRTNFYRTKTSHNEQRKKYRKVDTRTLLLFGFLCCTYLTDLSTLQQQR
jgi:hypothetical protein